MHEYGSLLFLAVPCMCVCAGQTSGVVNQAATVVVPKNIEPINGTNDGNINASGDSTVGKGATTTVTSAPSGSSGDIGTAKRVEATAAMKKSEVALSNTEGSVGANKHDSNLSHQTDQDKSGDKTIEAALHIGATEASERTYAVPACTVGVQCVRTSRAGLCSRLMKPSADVHGIACACMHALVFAQSSAV